MFRKTRGGFAFLAFYTGICIWALWAIPLNLGIDIRGGTELTYQLDVSRLKEDPGTISNQVKEIISRRLDLYGLKEIRIAVEGDDRIVVTLPGGDSDAVRRIREQVEKQGQLLFQLVADDSIHGRQTKAYEDAEAAYLTDLETYVSERREWGKRKAADPSFAVPEPAEPTAPEFVVRNHVAKEDPKLENSPTRVAERLVLDNSEAAKVSGALIAHSFGTVDDKARAAVGFQMTGDGAAKMGELTRLNQKKRMAIVLDGEVVSAPVIQSPITTDGVITGDFTQVERDGLVNILKGGSLAATPRLVGESTVGTTFGQEAIEASLRAVILGLIMILATMGGYYLVGGMVANFSLIFNVLTVLAYMVCFRQTLSLPGIAGLLLSVGMAVDANILIYERVREERARGKTLHQALTLGFQRAFGVILDSNLTTLITGFILFQFGSGPVKGFAVTLIAGVVVSFFSSLFVTRLGLSYLLNHGWLKTFKMLEFFGTPKIPFVSFQKPVMYVSAAIIAITWCVVFWRGRDNYGIDFTGGARVAMSLNQVVDRATMEGIVRGLEEQSSELFLDWTLQDVREDDGSYGRRFVLLTRAGIGRASMAKTASAQEAPAAPADAAALSGDDDAAQLVRVKLQEVLEAKGLLLPPPFAVTRWEATSDGKSSLVVEANFARLRDVTEDALRADLSTVLKRSPAFSGDEASGFPGIDIQELRISSMPPPEAKPAGRIEPTRVRVQLTPYAPPAPSARDSKIPTREQVESNLKAAFHAAEIKSRAVLCDSFPIVATVGPVVASNLQGKAIVAIFVSMLGIIFYMAMRFDFAYGVAAIVALVHDILITIGILSCTDVILGRYFYFKINLPEVAAILTLIGYSVNDTIVVFDRVRENLVLIGRKKLTFLECVNLSINQTLSRTVLTGLTTLWTLLALVLVGGEGVRGFAYTFFVGLVTGTFSSIFVASPILIMMRQRSDARREALIEAGEA